MKYVLLGAAGNVTRLWIGFSDEQAYEGMKSAGMPGEMVKKYTEMGAAPRSGTMQGGFLNNGHRPTGKRRLEQFAQEFAAA